LVNLAKKFGKIGTTKVLRIGFPNQRVQGFLIPKIPIILEISQVSRGLERPKKG